jgi:hypothetical protein
MNLKFKSTREQLPADDISIFYIKERDTLYGYSIEPKFTKVEWQWEDGEGTSVIHDNQFTVENRPEGFPYLTLVDEDGFTMWSDYFMPHWERQEPQHFWWITEDEFFEQLKNNRP